MQLYSFHAVDAMPCLAMESLTAEHWPTSSGTVHCPLRRRAAGAGEIRHRRLRLAAKRLNQQPIRPRFFRNKPHSEARTSNQLSGHSVDLMHLQRVLRDRILPAARLVLVLPLRRECDLQGRNGSRGECRNWQCQRFRKASNDRSDRQRAVFVSG